MTDSSAPATPVTLAGVLPVDALALGRSAWLEVDQDALRGNLSRVRSMVGPDVRIAAVVKADAYGHGLVPAARNFVAAGADRLCVATLDEALALRRSIDDVPILVLFAIPAQEVEIAARADLDLVASDESVTRATLSAWAHARRPGLVLRLHLEVETGLCRGGVMPEAVVRLMRTLLAQPQVEVAGLWSHLARAEDERASMQQDRRLVDVGSAVAEAGMPVPPLHLAGTGGLFAASCAHHAMVRPGLALYGELPDGLDVAPTAMAAASALRPALTLKARPVRVTSVPGGTPVGYGGRWVSGRPSRIATLPLGYGDGFARSSQPGGTALVRGARVPLVGTVAMDAVGADVTDMPDVGVDDEFVLLGAQGGERITATELAQRRTTISWEVLSSMAHRLPRVYHSGSRVISVRTMAGESLVGQERH